MVSDFEAAVERHQRKVYTFARYYLGQTQEAEDITQDVFLKLWHNRRRVDAEGTRAWLLRVTRNACFDRLRQRQSAAKVFAGDTEEPNLERVSTAAPGPEAHAAAADFRRHLGGALEQLTDPTKSIVILREIQGFKYREIAETLEMPVNTVKVYLRRGRLRLRDALREEERYATGA